MNTSLIDRLSEALLRMRRASAQLAGQLDVSILEFRALTSLRRNREGGEANVFAHDLVTDLRASKAAVSQMLKGLEQRGYIRRDFNPANRRKIALTLTEPGERAVLDTQLRFQAMMRDVIAEFGEEHAEQMVALVGRFAEVINRQLDQEE